MKSSEFDYNLPKELIAQRPIKPRDHSRLLVLSMDKSHERNKKIEHKHFYDLVDYLKKDDVLVLNNSKVFPARLGGKKAETGGKIEVFLLKENPTPTLPFERGGSLWQCLVGGKIRRTGQVVKFSKNFQAEILKDNQDGTWEVKFNLSGKEFWQAVDKVGEMPLPPYIKKLEVRSLPVGRAGNNLERDDKKNYQTVYADENKLGSVAAPTAGFHFTKGLLGKLKKKGVQFEYITLHVGLGSFAPVKVDDINKHKMHSEFVEVDAKTVRNIIKAKSEGRRVIAVGTTSVRTLEALFWKLEIGNWKLGRCKQVWPDFNRKDFKSISFSTDIFIYPGYKFYVVDAMITNFHLPKSTLLMLVSAMAGQENIRFAYKEAIRKRYRFYSYGDAMLII
jgi:S-adenosylmethionine:tRNA ribosyltransferase-isomerase